MQTSRPWRWLVAAGAILIIAGCGDPAPTKSNSAAPASSSSSSRSTIDESAPGTAAPARKIEMH